MMNADQEIFYKCMMDRAKVDKQAELDTLIKTTIEAADELEPADYDVFNAKVVSLIKPETVVQVQDNLAHFKAQYSGSLSSPVDGTK